MDRDDILSLFENNERTAAGYIATLVSYGLVGKMGETEDHDLPKMLYKEDKAETFIEAGGFITLFNNANRENKVRDLTEANLKLQNENLLYVQTIRDQEKRIRNLDEHNKFFELVKNYWWLLSGLFALGVVIAKYFL